MIKSCLKPVYNFKPIKMPRGLIYNSGNNRYRLLESKTGKQVGEMLAAPVINDKSYYAKKTENDLIFQISFFDIPFSEQGKGWGEYFIKFAKNESVRKKCGKRIFLTAYNYEKSPHAFYYKQGFVTLDKNTNAILEEYVKNHWIPFHWDAMEMYLPEESYNNALKIVKNESKFLNRIKKILKIFQ